MFTVKGETGSVVHTTGIVPIFLLSKRVSTPTFLKPLVVTVVSVESQVQLLPLLTAFLYTTS